MLSRQKRAELSGPAGSGGEDKATKTNSGTGTQALAPWRDEPYEDDLGPGSSGAGEEGKTVEEDGLPDTVCQSWPYHSWRVN